MATQKSDKVPLLHYSGNKGKTVVWVAPESVDAFKTDQRHKGKNFHEVTLHIADSHRHRG